MNQPPQIVVKPIDESELRVLNAHEVNPANNATGRHWAKQQQGNYIWAVAWRGNEPLGTCALDWNESDTNPELKNLWVYPSKRRLGVGRALTQWVENYARQLGYREIFLAVTLSNEAAIPLYVSLEYSPTGTQREESYSYLDQDGVRHDVDEVVAVFRKSLTVTVD